MKLLRAVLVMSASLASVGVATAAEYIVDQKKNKFAPRDMTIKAGDKITFRNSDPYRHHVGNGDNQMKFGKVMPPGKSYTQLFDEKGRFKVRCAMHPKMRMNVTVE